MPANLVIVESPAKAKTIKKFLGKDFAVEASMGHIRDLPQKKLGVDTESGSFTPLYEIPEEKKTVIKNLKKILKESQTLWIATDEDREGEAIGWHLLHALGIPKGEMSGIKRIVFHEITEDAIKEAMRTPRTIDQKLVDAQQARRILDRLVGYTLSPFLWSKVYRGLSAGRVQSVAVRVIVDREREVQAFRAEEYWTIAAELLTGKQDVIIADLKRRSGKTFVPTTEEEAQTVLSDLRGADFIIGEIEEKRLQRNPTAPFTTSTLQQTASNKLGFSVKQTMVVAQQLYEGVNLGKGLGQTGLITYMRTDSVTLSKKALEDSKQVIEKVFGREYILTKPRTYKTKSKNAQEAHEAIRPTELHRTPDSLKDILDPQQLKLYSLIWQRTIASQMPAAEIRRVAVDIDAGKYSFRATGQTIEFDGFLRAYGGNTRAEEDSDEEDEHTLPPLQKGEGLTCTQLTPQQHFTKPPARYTEATLVKKLEEEGIGRPSTYAPTISTVQQRGYIRKDGRQLIPESVAFTVTDLMTEHFPEIVDLKFTAKMEQSLDDIAIGKQECAPFLKGFFKPFKALVEHKTAALTKEDISPERILGKDPTSGLEVIARVGRFGPYVQIGRKEEGPKGAKGAKGPKPRSASIPKTIQPDALTLEQALNLLSFPKVLGTVDGNDVIIARGRFGPYVKWGEATSSLPKEADLTVLTLDDALRAMTEAKEKKQRMAEPILTLGNDPVSGGKILVKDGRYGPYVTDGTTNASLSRKIEPATVTQEQAVEILAKKRARGPGKRRGFGQKKGEK